MEHNYQFASKEYKKGFKSLNLDQERIVKIDELSETLEAISGWTLISVNGLIPTRDFFFMIINKKYPVTVLIRKPHEIEFSEQPDIFHDIYGHVPLLTSEKFYKFLTEFSTIALKYIDDPRAVEELGRLYWYTYEMGVIYEEDSLRSYGGAIITSDSELRNVKDPAVAKIRFDLDEVLHAPYNYDRLQDKYFAIDTFDDLFNCVSVLEEKLDNASLARKEFVLNDYHINSALEVGFRDTIGFLNGIQFRYPDAISFAAGQPDETLFDVDKQMQKFDRFVEYQVQRLGKDRLQVVNQIAQYGKTKGIINDIIAEHVRVDDNIHVNADDILITVGAQEAFSIAVATLVNREDDVILIEDPSFIGLSGFARLLGYPIEPVRINDEGIDLDLLERKILDCNSRNKRVKLVYVIPDFQNPSGVCMPIGHRLRLLELSVKYNFLILEDSVYNSFTYAQKKNPSIKSLDINKRVIYVGSFSKSLFPGLRIGYMLADQKFEDYEGNVHSLSDEFSKVKAHITNNTSGINQAIVGGIILDANYSLHDCNEAKYEYYKRKRDKIIECLDEMIGRYTFEWAAGIEYSRPEGGFFIRLRLPFSICDDDVVECARDYGVIFCPMAYFCLNNDIRNEIRLTFSNLSLQKIESGILKLSEFLKSKAKLTISDEVQLGEYSAGQ
jgi:(S)-3,5-dihydroxyphenylglycine transaminase